MSPHALFLDWLVRVSWQSALLIALVLLTQRLLRHRLSAGWRCALWWVVVARLALPFSFSSSASLFNLLPRRPVVAPPAAGTSTPGAREFVPVAKRAVVAESPSSVPAPPSAPAGAPGEAVSPPAAPPEHDGAAEAFVAPAAPRVADAPPLPPPARDWRVMLFWGWLAGAGALVGVTLVQVGRARGRLRAGRVVTDADARRTLAACCREMGLRRPPELREAPRLASPALCGFRRPRILLPVDFRRRFSARELRFVLLHELAHLKRGDVILNWALTVVQIVHWFNPLVWLAFARMRADRELACDAMALAVAGAGERRRYGETILRLLEDFRAPAALSNWVGIVGILEDRGRLKERLEFIVRFRRPGRWSAWAGLLLAGMAVTGLTDAKKNPPAAAGADAASTAEPSAPAPAAASACAPLSLTDFYVTRWDTIPPGTSWTAVPKGRQEFDGIPYDLGGLIELTGLGALGDDKGLPSRVSEIPVGRKATFLHLIHGTAYAAPEGTPMARLVLRYADGQRRELLIRYGVHVRNWWREPNETSAALSDPRSGVVWSGTSPETDRYGVGLRLFHTRLANPRPTTPIASLDLISLLKRPTWVVLGITLETTASPTAPAVATAAPAEEPPAVRLPETLVARVVDRRTGRPLPGAVVQLQLTGAEKEYRFGGQRADADGRVTLDLPPDGFEQGAILARAPGCQPLRYELFSPLQNKTLELALKRGVTIGGVVTDPAGTPVAGARVKILGTRKDEVGQVVEFEIETVATDAQGRWRCASVPPSPKHLSFEVTHPAFYPADFDQAEDGATGPEALTARRLRAEQARFVLRPGVPVSGVVRAPDGQAVAGASVTLMFGGERPRQQRAARTDTEGRFRFVIPTEGPARLWARAEGFAPTSVPFDLKPDLEPLAITLDSGRILRGRVVDEKNQPVADAMIRLVNSELPAWQTKTDDTGQFTWKNAPTERITLKVDKAGYEPAVRDVLLAATDKHLVIRLSKRLQITGRVIEAETGKPITDFQLLMGWGSRPENEVTWQALWGGFQLTREGGQFRLSMPRQGMPTTHLLAIAPGHLQASPPLKLTETNELVFKLKKDSGLSGTVTAADGQPVAGAQVALSGIGCLQLEGGRLQHLASISGLQLMTQTDTNGQFRLFRGVPAPRLVAVHPDYGFARFSGETLARTNRVVLQPWGRVEGVLRIGRRVGTNREVVLMHRKAFPELYYDLNSFRTTTDEQGRFAFDFVPPGSQTLVRPFKVSGWTLYTHQFPVRVRPGEVVHVVYGGTGRPVIGRVAPAKPGQKIDWKQSDCRLAIRPPQPPLEVKTPEERQTWYQSAEFKRAVRNGRTYPVVWSKDGSFRVDDVLPGQYELYFRFVAPAQDSQTDAQMRQRYGLSGPIIGSLRYEFEVPPIPGGRSDEPLDLGELKVNWVDKAQPPSAEAPGPVGWQTLDGQPAATGELLRDCTVLVFWSAAHPPTEAELATLGELAGQYREDDRFALYGVVTDDDPKAARAFAQKAKPAWPQLTPPPEPRPKMLAREGIASLPAMVLLRPDRDPLTGLNAADLKKTVAEALAATPARHSDSFPVRDETSATLRPLAGRCFSAAFSPDGKTLAVAGGWDNPPEPGEVTLWNLGSRRPVWMRRQDEACRAVLFSPDGRHLAVGDFGGRVRLLDPATGRVQRELPGHEDLVNSLAFSADGRLLASGGFDDMAQVVEAATGAVRQKWSLTDHILCVALSPDGRRMAASTWQGRLFVWDVSDGSKRWESTGCRNLPDAGVEVVRFAPDGKTLFTGSRDRSLVQWRARDGKLLREFKGHVKGIQNIQFSPDGRLMASSDASGAVRLWDLVGGSPRGRWQAHPERCFGLAFSPGGGRVATASWDYTAKVWDTATFLPLAVLDRKTVTLP